MLGLPCSTVLPAWILLCLGCEGVLPPFSSPRGEPVPVLHWDAEEGQSAAAGGSFPPEAVGSLVFAAPYPGHGAWRALPLGA